MEENRKNLEVCLNEFFSQQTTNDRKRELEVMLDSFTKQSESWKQAMYFLSSPARNHFVSMYSIRIIETTIRTRWITMSQGEQNELKNAIFTFLSHDQSLPPPGKSPPFIRNKIVKLITDIGKFSWPNQYPDFFTNVYQLLSGNDTLVLGLMFLKTISEEWPNAKDEISTQRRIEIKYHLVQEMQRIFEFLHKILVSAIKEKEEMTLRIRQHLECTDPENSENLPPVNTQLSEIVNLALDTTAQYCSWIPFDGIILNSNVEQKSIPFTLDFVRVICQYSLGIFNSPGFSDTKQSIMAMSALNELLYRKFFPKEFDDQMKFIVNFSLDLLQKILRVPVHMLQNEYMEKVVEFLCLITSGHFFRFTDAAGMNFMGLLLPFTFRQSKTHLYYESLEIWARLLDYVQILTNTRDDFLENYKQPFLNLATGIVQSTVKFQPLLEECFDTEEDDESEVPSLMRNIDILVKIGELLPNDSLLMVTSTWTESCRFYHDLQSYHDASKPVMRIENTVEVEHFNFIVQLVGRIANIFYGDVFKQEIELGKSLFQQLVGIAVFSKKYYNVKNPEVIVHANCEIIYSLKTWCYWLARFHSEVVLAEMNPADLQLFYELLNHIVELVFFSLENRGLIPNAIVLALSSLLSTIVNSVRTQYLFQIPSVKALVEKIHTLRSTMNFDTFRVLNKAVAGLLLLPWQNVPNQEWERRTELYKIYMRPLTDELYQSAESPSSIILILNVFNDQLDMLLSECANSKKIVWEVMKDLVPFLQRLSASYLQKSIVCEEILNFFLKIMEVLRQQSGSSFFEESIRGFLEIFSSQNLINDLLRETEPSSIVVEKFLKMLEFMVKDPSPSFKKFLPDTLSFCYDHVYPILAQRSSPDLKIPFFQLVRDAVNYRWNYFFPALIARNSSLENDQGQNSTEALATKRLDQILQSIGNSFLQPEFQVFRFNIETLGSWNEKHHLFTKLATLDPRLLNQFLTVLIQVLVQKSHDLLREEVSVILWEIAREDFPKFYEQFIPNFLATNFPLLKGPQRDNLAMRFPTGFSETNSNDMMGEASGGSNENRGTSANLNNNHMIDMPSFVIALSKFIDDLRYFYFMEECVLQTSPTEGSHLKSM